MPLFLLVQERDALVGRYAVQPRIQLCIFPEIVQVFPYFDEYILNQIVSVIVVDDQTPHMPIDFLLIFFQELRSEERRVGKECVRTCRSRCLTYHQTKNTVK